MKIINKAITATLGAALLFCIILSDRIYDDSLYVSRTEERIKYAELDADPHGTYAGYTVEEFGEGYKKPSDFMGRVLIDFPILSQYPELPTGCEITCGAALLNYLGFDIDKVELSDNYMHQSTHYYLNGEGENCGPDPFECFAGDPKGAGFGCYAPVITDALNSYLTAMEMQYYYKAVTMKNMNSADMEKLLDEGVPLIVWASQKMDAFKYVEQSEWKGTGTERQIKWLGNSHTYVLVGYDPNAYYFMDCGENAGIVTYSKEAFLKRWQENGMQMVAIKIL